MTKIYTVIIVDDERLAREEVKRALEPFSGFKVIGEAANATDAKTLIYSKEVDLLFLDIHMPEKSGLQLLEELTIVPEVVFTTAYDQHAVKAFELNALDYLVKPLRQERFQKTMGKVKKVLIEKYRNDQPLSVQKKIFIKDKERYHLIEVDDIWLIESLENYARIHYGPNTVLMHRSLNLLEAKLSSQQFFRINRSQLINMNYIKEAYPYFKNKLKLTLTTNKSFEVSVRQSVKLKKVLGL